MVARAASGIQVAENRLLSLRALAPPALERLAGPMHESKPGRTVGLNSVGNLHMPQFLSFFLSFCSTGV